MSDIIDNPELANSTPTQKISRSSEEAEDSSSESSGSDSLIIDTRTVRAPILQ
jgi:hypothetical protein